MFYLKEQTSTTFCLFVAESLLYVCNRDFLLLLYVTITESEYASAICNFDHSLSRTVLLNFAGRGSVLLKIFSHVLNYAFYFRKISHLKQILLVCS